MNEEKTVLATLLKRFNMRVIAPNEVEMDPAIVLRVKRGLYVTAEPREKNEVKEEAKKEEKAKEEKEEKVEMYVI